MKTWQALALAASMVTIPGYANVLLSEDFESMTVSTNPPSPPVGCPTEND